MKPVQFPQQNVILGENQPEYLPLPAFWDGSQMITAWELTDEERIEFLRTGRIYLTQLTFGSPFQPVRLEICCPITDEQNSSFQ